MLGPTAAAYPVRVNPLRNLKTMLHSKVIDHRKMLLSALVISVKSLHSSTFFEKKKKHVLLENKYYFSNHHLKVKLQLAEAITLPFFYEQRAARFYSK